MKATKKIFSIFLVVLLILSATTTAFANEITDLSTQRKLENMADDDTTYFLVRWESNIPVFEFSCWVEQNSLLPDVMDYTVEYGEELVADYMVYVAEQRAKVEESNRQFFAEHFNASTDELVYSSNNTDFLVVKATKASVLKVAELEDCYVLYVGATESAAQTFIDDNDRYNWFPERFTMDPYELVYAVHHFEGETFERDWREYWTYPGYFYVHLYNHYPAGAATADESTPDYVLVHAGNDICSPAGSAGGFGDYLVTAANIYYPYTLGYYIITTEDMNVLTLREAWDAQIPNIEDVFEDYGLGVKRGDSNLDGEINIKDATFIQKCIAGIEEFADGEYAGGFAEGGQGEDGFYHGRVSDVNIDDEVNVKDATTIQKRLAGLE